MKIVFLLLILFIIGCSSEKETIDRKTIKVYFKDGTHEEVFVDELIIPISVEIDTTKRKIDRAR